MFRGSPEHDGVAFTSLPGSPVAVPGILPVTPTGVTPTHTTSSNRAAATSAARA
jgi:hypothetical protein